MIAANALSISVRPMSGAIMFTGPAKRAGGGRHHRADDQRERDT